jgi:hypothetical protein
MMRLDIDDGMAAPGRDVRPALMESEAALRLGVKAATLRAWRHQGKGPAFVRFGRAVRYLVRDIEDFEQASRHAPSAETDRR